MRHTLLKKDDEQITVGELQDMLRNIPKDTKIVVCVDKGDYRSTDQYISGLEYNDIEEDLTIHLSEDM